MDFDELRIADSVMPEALAHLADLEWRSRLDAGPFYAEAGDDLARALDRNIALWREANTEAKRIALRLWPDAFREQVAIDAIEHAALTSHHLIVPLIGPGTRMYLGRSWRVWVRDVVTTS